MLDDRVRHARGLFDGIAPSYETPASVLSLGQYGRWRRALVDNLNLKSNALALDIATGTGLIARDVERRYRCTVVGLDQSGSMLAAARAHGVDPLTGGSALALPFADETFGAVTFSYLLRYVPDPAAALREIARVVRPEGVVGSVEFGVPTNPLARLGWRAYAQGIFPAACRRYGDGWPDVADFLPGSIVRWGREWPIERQRAAWRDAGIDVRQVVQRTLGAGVAVLGVKR
ncbi:MAG TPA: class I SAM-dependent methyltransferase [Actinomycetota bacterium]|nr:class I SAM-dependent methyltransferase [Actinomycetota bacterium]